MVKSALISRYLYQAKYRYQDKTKKDVLNTINFYKGLNAQLDFFTFPNGDHQELLALQGTIPINFRGKIYHIPICIWLKKDYPYSPPMCYVKPTSNMTIKTSKVVDSEGKIYLPYLSNWNADTYDILGVIQVMIIVFGEAPPVYQKPKNQPVESSVNPYATPTPTPGFPPLPTSSHPPMPPALPTASYPNSNLPFSTPYPYTNYSSTVSTPYSNTPYPPYPTFSPASTTTYPVGSELRMTSSNSSSGTITEEHIRASLISAIEDKSKTKLREKLGQCQAEIDVLRKTSDELTKGKARLEGILSKMEDKFSDLEKCKKELQLKDSQIDKLLDKFEDEGKNDIDDAFAPNEPLYKQLLNAFAEENAIVDAIYYLGEALRKGVIDLEIFLKNTRELSRRQFMLRALMQKCRERAGLPY